MPRNFTLSIFTENSPGVLHRITVLFTRRKLNIESLTVSETERKGISRFTIVVNTQRELIEKVAKQINRIIEVRDIFVSENHELVFREIAFYKVSADSAAKRAEVEELAHRYGAAVAHAAAEFLIVEKTGAEQEINSLFLLLEPLGIREFVRSGRIAILNREQEPDALGLNPEANE